MFEIIKVYIDNDSNLILKMNQIAFLFSIITVVLIIIIVYKNKKFYYKLKDYWIESIEIGNKSKIKIRPNIEDMQIAYKIYIELTTRKIGLPIDLKNDFILELYNSWHTFFGTVRELTKTIPVRKIQKSSGTKAIVNTAINVLNEGLRPHLTIWQAKFRKWYLVNSELSENNDKTPQEIQELYPHYDELVEDIKKVNVKLVDYRLALRQIAYRE